MLNLWYILNLQHIYGIIMCLQLCHTVIKSVITSQQTHFSLLWWCTSTTFKENAKLLGFCAYSWLHLFSKIFSSMMTPAPLPLGFDCTDCLTPQGTKSTTSKLHPCHQYLYLLIINIHMNYFIIFMYSSLWSGLLALFITTTEKHGEKNSPVCTLFHE